MKIERDKVYLTRDGEKVRVICTDRPVSAFPVVGIDASGNVMSFTASGGAYTGEKSRLDLVSEYVEPPKPREVWVAPSDATLNWAAYPDAALTHLNPQFAARLVKFREVIEA